MKKLVMSLNEVHIAEVNAKNVKVYQIKNGYQIQMGTQFTAFGTIHNVSMTMSNSTYENMFKRAVEILAARSKGMSIYKYRTEVCRKTTGFDWDQFDK